MRCKQSNRFTHLRHWPVIARTRDVSKCQCQDVNIMLIADTKTIFSVCLDFLYFFVVFCKVWLLCRRTKIKINTKLKGILFWSSHYLSIWLTYRLTTNLDLTTAIKRKVCEKQNVVGLLKVPRIMMLYSNTNQAQPMHTI